MKLWLCGVSATKKVQGVRALREIAKEAVSDAALFPAIRIWDAAAVGKATLLATTDDPAKLQRLTELCERGHLQYNLTPDTEFPPPAEGQAAPKPNLQRVEIKAEAEPPTYEAGQVAGILLAGTSGDPSAALAMARSFQRITEDDLWAEAAAFLIDTFPSPEALMEWLQEQGE